MNDCLYPGRKDMRRGKRHFRLLFLWNQDLMTQKSRSLQITNCLNTTTKNVCPVTQSNSFYPSSLTALIHKMFTLLFQLKLGLQERFSD